MARTHPLYLLTIPAMALAAAALAAAGSAGGFTFRGIPVFGLCIGLAFACQWVAFVPAWLARSERYFDLVGSLTYLGAILLAGVLSPVADARSYILVTLVVIWALRLGLFLFARIRAAGADQRFDTIRHDFRRFLVTWTLQGLWVSFTLAAALAAVTSLQRSQLGAFAAAGTGLWTLGFIIEVVADRQKRAFRADPEHANTFIATGLWAWSRHPNYFGEILVWAGIALIALPNLHGWQWLTMISPLFVATLLTRVSGVPLLERQADRRWGGRADYETYKRHTPLLIPRRPRRSQRGER